MGRHWIDEEKIIRHIEEGKYASEVARLCDVSTTCVYNVAKRNGLEVARHPLSGRGEELEQWHNTLRRLVDEGLTCPEIARATGKDRSNIRQTCVKLGLAVNKGGTDTEGNLAKAIENCERYGFEYINGYENAHSVITVRRKQCGHVYEKSYLSFLSKECNGSTCPVCSEQRRKEKEKKRTYKPNWKRIEGTQTKIAVCRTCGVPFVTTRNWKVYCSNSCRVKSNEKAHELVRQKRIVSNSKPDSIALRTLFEKGNGRCWICGGVCNYEDYHRNDNGAFVAGDSYPSIDHVVPLSKGGAHKWNNVRLAHRSCNTKRGNRYPPGRAVTTERL